MKTKFCASLCIIILAAGSVLAADPVKPSASLTTTWEANYLYALTLDNTGVRQSAADYIGEYRLTGAEQELIEVLRNDKVEAVRMAAAQALIRLGSGAGRQAVEEAAIYDGSDKVVRYCEELLAGSANDLSIR